MFHLLYTPWSILSSPFTMEHRTIDSLNYQLFLYTQTQLEFPSSSQPSFAAPDAQRNYTAEYRRSHWLALTWTPTFAKLQTGPARGLAVIYIQWPFYLLHASCDSHSWFELDDYQSIDIEVPCACIASSSSASMIHRYRPPFPGMQVFRRGQTLSCTLLYL